MVRALTPSDLKTVDNTRKAQITKPHSSRAMQVTSLPVNREIVENHVIFLAAFFNN